MGYLSAAIELLAVFLRGFFGRWLAPKDDGKEFLRDAIKAKQEDSTALAAPPRPDAELDDLVRDHWRE